MLEEKKKPLNKLTFEDAMSELEGIARSLEDGSLGLDDSIVEFERGAKLVKLCQVKLDEAERKIEILQKGEDADETIEKKKKKVRKKKIKVKEDTGEIDDNED
ncbi:MAG: exodeoxyribonuclease VII small subunit, partial [bacterium]|nr:exodeoxyribonuclease VII small subunit [bacterium]